MNAYGETNWKRSCLQGVPVYVGEFGAEHRNMLRGIGKHIPIRNPAPKKQMSLVILDPQEDFRAYVQFPASQQLSWPYYKGRYASAFIIRKVKVNGQRVSLKAVIEIVMSISRWRHSCIFECDTELVHAGLRLGVIRRDRINSRGLPECYKRALSVGNSKFFRFSDSLRSRCTSSNCVNLPLHLSQRFTEGIATRSQGITSYIYGILRSVSAFLSGHKLQVGNTAANNRNNYERTGESSNGNICVRLLSGGAKEKVFVALLSACLFGYLALFYLVRSWDESGLINKWNSAFAILWYLIGQASICFLAVWISPDL